MKNVYREWVKERLKGLRSQSSKEQADVARAINSKPGTYASYEEARCMPSVFTIKRICVYYGITLDEFMQGAPVNADPSL